MISRHIENDTLEYEITREELQDLASNEDITINWNKWNELVERTKEDIHTLLEDTSIPHKYVYTLEGKLIGKFKTTKECSTAVGISPDQINIYIRTGRPYIKGKMIFRNAPMTPKQIWVYNLHNILVGVYANQMEAAEHLHTNHCTICRHIKSGTPIKSLSLLFYNSPLHKDEME